MSDDAGFSESVETESVDTAGVVAGLAAGLAPGGGHTSAKPGKVLRGPGAR